MAKTVITVTEQRPHWTMQRQLAGGKRRMYKQREQYNRSQESTRQRSRRRWSTYLSSTYLQLSQWLREAQRGQPVEHQPVLR